MGATFDEADCTVWCEIFSALFLVYFPPLFKDSEGLWCELTILVNVDSDGAVFFDADPASGDYVALLES